MAKLIVVSAFIRPHSTWRLRDFAPLRQVSHSNFVLSMIGKYTWERRIERATQLAQSSAHAQQILTFYAEVLKWQREFFRRLSATSGTHHLTGSLEIDGQIFLDQFSSLLSLARQYGSDVLAAQAVELASERNDWKEVIASYWNGDAAFQHPFFARAFLQPYLELLAGMKTPPADSRLTSRAQEQLAAVAEAQAGSLCPFCGRKPQLALLSNETDVPGVAGSAEGGQRFLMCCDCLTLWRYQRIACVHCREEDPYKLPCYSAQQIPNIRVECCDSCNHYIKSIDLTKDNRFVPPVDELAAIPLDLWAQEKGYVKIRCNLAGM